MWNASGPIAALGTAYGGNCADQTGTNGNISTDPLFLAPLTDNYRLGAGSAAIDAGDNSNAAIPTADLDGSARLVDGDGNGSTVVDMGAYEFLFDPNGVLQFSALQYGVNEQDGSIEITVLRTTGTNGSVSVDFATSDGSALSGLDYTPVSGTFTFADGDSTPRSFSIPIVVDGDGEPDKTINLTLSNVQGGAILGLNSTSVVTVTDVVQFVMSRHYPLEPGRKWVFEYTNGGGFSEDVLLGFVTLNGTPTRRVKDNFNNAFYFSNDDDGLVQHGSDSPGAFAPGTDTLRFVPGLEIADAIVEIGDSVTTSGTVTFVFADVGSFPLSYDATSVVDSLETLTVPLGTFEALKLEVTIRIFGSIFGSLFDETEVDTVWYVEDLGLIRQDITFDGETEVYELTGTNPVITSPVPGSELPGSVVTFEWEDRGAPVLQRLFYVGTQPGTANLHNSGVLGAGVLSRTVAGLPIDSSPVFVRLWHRPTTTNSWSWRDFEFSAGPPPQTLQFTVSELDVNEDGGTAMVTVSREGPTTGAVGVDFATSDGTATAGADYTSTSGTLSWGDGDGSDKTFTVTITDDPDPEGTETIVLALSNATGGALVGSPGVSTLTINASDIELPELTSPEPGGALPGSTVTFEWSTNGTPVSQWLLYVGTSPVGPSKANLHNSGVLGGGVTQRTVSGLPTNGATVYVNLLHRAVPSGTWTVIVEQYSNGSP